MTQVKTTLHRSLSRLINDYPLPDVIEQLASIAFDHKLEKTAEILDAATDTALEESGDRINAISPKEPIEITYIGEIDSLSVGVVN